MFALGGGWTLVARLSNSDLTHWTGNNSWWLTRMASEGDVLSPTSKGDMISETFWTIAGNQILITNSSRVNESLVHTMPPCLKGKSVRSIFSNCHNVTESYSECKAEGLWQKNCQASVVDICVGNDNGSQSWMSIRCEVSKSAVQFGGGLLHKDFEVDVSGTVHAPTDYSVNIWVR